MTKICDIQIQGNRCYYRLSGCSDNEYTKILEYKSWIFKSWTEGSVRKYFIFPYPNKNNERIIWSYVGFSPILIRYLQSLGYLVNGKELFRSREIRLGNMLYKLYDYQEQAVNEWLRSGCCGVIKICTGGGKTITACDIIRRMKVRAIIVVHTSDLLINAWLNTLVEQFGESVKSQIGIVGGGLSKKDRKNMRIISDTSYENNIKQDIVIATAQSLLNKLDKLSNEKFGIICFDEVHHVAAEQFSKVAGSIKAPYRIGLSATLYRSDGASPLIWGLMGDVVYKISIRELVSKKVLVEPIFNTIIINDEKVQNEIASSGLSKLDLSRYVKKLSSSSDVKMNYILKLAKSLSNNGKKFIMYTDFVSNENGGVYTRDYYVKKLTEMGIKVIGISSDMSGGEREKIFNMLKSGKLDGLIMGKLGAEGINIVRVDSIIMNNATKSTILFPQRTGRSMRVVKEDSSKKNAYIYEVILNTPLELRWSDANFYEYQLENYVKEKVYIK